MSSAGKVGDEVQREARRYGVELTGRRCRELVEVAERRARPFWWKGVNTEEYLARVVTIALEEAGVPDPEVDVD